MKIRFLLLFVALALSVSAQGASPTCGLTIITHGFQPQRSGMAPIPAWMIAMEDAIRARIGSDLPTYLVRFQRSGSQPTAHRIFPNGSESADPATPIDITEQGGAIILLDWFDASDEAQKIPTQNVADQFFDFLFGRAHNGHNLVEVPIHLIGHSRGASLNSRLAYRLALSGILVEQVTTLDPHPVTIAFATDRPVTTYINTVFADNYYRTGAAPVGQSVPGARNFNLSAIIGGTSLSCIEHAEVHTYYHGTIALTATTDGDCTIQDASWYQQSVARKQTGFNFSRYTGFDVPRPLDGVNRYIVGAGGSGSRELVDSPSQFWPNAGFDQRSSIPDRVTVGKTVAIPYYYCDRSSQQTITFSLDADTNPFNGERRKIGSEPQSSLPGVNIGSAMFSWTPTASDIGTHFIRVKTANTRADGVRVRYDYYLKPVTVQTDGPVTPIYTFTTLAGLAGSYGSVDGTGSDARFGFNEGFSLWTGPTGVAVDSTGNVYVADTYNRTIRKVTPTGVVTTLAGLAGSSGSLDGTGSAARFSKPTGVALDSAGNIHVADSLNDTIRKVTPTGV